MLSLICFLYAWLLVSCMLYSAVASYVTPVVGVFSEPLDFLHRPSNKRNDTSRTLSNSSSSSRQHYIAASYQKWLEVGGLRSIPIPYDASPALMDEIFAEINALLLPGGNSPILNDGVKYMLDLVVQSNRRDHVYFPVWGTCLGMEHLVAYFGGVDVLSHDYNAENMTLALEQVDRQASVLYNESTIYRMVTTLPIALNNHRSGVSPTNFQASQLNSIFAMTSTNVDVDGRPFVSTMESRRDLLPVVGVQYHPEKNLFEYGTYPPQDNNATAAAADIPYEVIAHTFAGRFFSFHLAQVWGQMARRGQRLQRQAANGHNKHIYTGKFPVLSSYPTQAGISFEQVYLIPSASAAAADHTTATTVDKAAVV
jgi:gamma-glutamyl hydrolase